MLWFPAFNVFLLGILCLPELGFQTQDSASREAVCSPCSNAHNLNSGKVSLSQKPQAWFTMQNGTQDKMPIHQT